MEWWKQFAWWRKPKPQIMQFDEVSVDLATASLDALVEANLALGRKSDAIREQRVAIRRRVDQMLEAK